MAGIGTRGCSSGRVRTARSVQLTAPWARSQEQDARRRQRGIVEPRTSLEGSPIRARLCIVGEKPGKDREIARLCAHGVLVHPRAFPPAFSGGGGTSAPRLRCQLRIPPGPPLGKGGARNRGQTTKSRNRGQTTKSRGSVCMECWFNPRALLPPFFKGGVESASAWANT